MCGLTGYLSASVTGTEQDMHALLRPMADAIRHRGPDSDGFWVDTSNGIGLAHRRLAIVDLSAAGHQPMASVSGRYVLAFNGEIYNHMGLRDELRRAGAAPQWRGHSDTETLLAGIDTWGLQGTLQRCIGMFAIALWDRQSRSLTLARDRMGEKPLYYGWQRRGNISAFLFGSELKALRAHPSFEGDVDRDALALLLRHNYIGAPHSIYKGLLKLQPGHLLQVSLAHPDPVLTSYWDACHAILSGTQQRFTGSAADAAVQLEALLKDAIGQQMVADVPLGAFLSGGVDSSAIVALMQTLSSRPVKTFSIGFNDESYDEAPFAKVVAKHLGTEHTELYVSAEQAMSVIPKLPAIYCEPFSDSSQIPTYLVSQMAREHVTVSLSGDAGDELFCGYTRYQVVDRLWHRLRSVPLPLRQLAASAIKSLPPATWDRLLAFAPYALIGEKLHKGAAVLTCNTTADVYRGLVSHWSDPAQVVIGAADSDGATQGHTEALNRMSDLEQMMYLDMLNYLPDDILVKVDRAAMGVSLETRVPFLDHRVVEFACRLPIDMKLRKGVTKWPLREVLYRHVPKELIERPKRGFAVPIDSWLRGPLRTWAEELLDESRLRREGFFNPAPIRKMWEQHQSGRLDRQYHLWDILMFQGWLESQKAD